MEYLLISSDPAIYSIRTKISVEIEQEDSESTEINYRVQSVHFNLFKTGKVEKLQL